MKIIEILSKESLIPELKSRTKIEVLKELMQALSCQEEKIDEDCLLEVLLEREKLGSTGIGDGIAIPHGKLKNISKLMVSFGRSTGGVDFMSMDGKPAHLFFLLVAPENSTGIHLKALARISRLLKDASFRQKLMKTSSKEELYQIIAEEDRKY